MKKVFFLLALTAGASLFFVGCQKNGCTDPLATNYNPDAKEDDGSCKYGSAGSGEVIELTKNIEAATTFKKGQKIKVCGNIKVSAALTIEPDVLIEMCPNASFDVSETGSFKAIGTSSAPIIIKGQVSTAGNWGFIHINSNNPDNIMEHVKISDGGGSSYYENATIWVNDNNNGQLSMENVTITNSKKIGVILEKGARFPHFAHNTFTGNGTFGVQIAFSDIGSLDGNSDYSGNGEDYIRVVNGVAVTNQTVSATNVPYLIDDAVAIDAGLTLSPGVEFKMGANAGIDVRVNGYLYAVGTASNPIKITGKTSTFGYWNTLHINSNNPKNEFKFVEIADGGGSSYYEYATIWVNDNNTGQFTMHNSKVSNGYGWGLYVEKASVSIITPNTETGMRNENSFSGNGGGSSSNCTGDCDVVFK